MNTLAPSAAAGLYLHIPFCLAKCRYCDFCSYSGLDSLHAPYVAALLKHIRQQAEGWPGPSFDTLYVGGGTPTVLPAELLVTLAAACQSELGLTADAEVTCEANPGTVSTSTFRTLREGGFNRLSLGAQSFDDGTLRVLGRIHDAQAIKAAVGAAREAGFSNLGLDLIYGVPDQSLALWSDSLRSALELQPEHLSLYALTLEEGTPLAEWVGRGELAMPDDDLVADMYALAQEALAQAGYTQYEISNWARRSPCDHPDGIPQLASRHNLHYWHNDHYLGLGSAAYSFDGNARYGRCSNPATYITRVKTGVDTTETSEEIGPELEMDETVMLGLRLAHGLEWETFRRRFGVDLRAVYPTVVASLAETGLVQMDDVGLRLAPHAYLIGNRVFAEFLR